MASKSANLAKATIVLCDIEGTTTSISFVKDTLFPYVLSNVEKFLVDSWDKDEIKTICDEFRKQSAKDVEEKLDGATAMPDATATKDEQIAALVKIVQWQMSIDRKADPLKTLQGLIWTNGYNDESIKAHIYDDVAKAFDDWTKNDIKIYIYSSGSVQAQKLLFGHTTDGDLLPKLSGHFDTKIGLKVEKQSYIDIMKSIDAKPENVVFLTDIVKEASAAKEAGVKSILLERPGNAPLTDDDKSNFPIVKSFAEIIVDESVTVATNGKRKSIEKEEVQEPPTKIIKTDKDETDKAAIVAEDEVSAKEPTSIKKVDEDEKMEEDQVADVAKVEEAKVVADGADKNSVIANTDEKDKKVDEPMDVEEDVVAMESKSEKNGAENEKVIPNKEESVTNKTANNGDVVAIEKNADENKSETLEEADKKIDIKKTDDTVAEKITEVIEATETATAATTNDEIQETETTKTDDPLQNSKTEVELKNGDVSKTEPIESVEEVTTKKDETNEKIKDKEPEKLEPIESAIEEKTVAEETLKTPSTKMDTEDAAKETKETQSVAKKSEDEIKTDTEMPTITVTSETGEKMDVEEVVNKTEEKIVEKDVSTEKKDDLANGDEKMKKKPVEDATAVEEKPETRVPEIAEEASKTQKSDEKEKCDKVETVAGGKVAEDKTEKVTEEKVQDTKLTEDKPEANGDGTVDEEEKTQKGAVSTNGSAASTNGDSPVKNGNDSDKENDIAPVAGVQNLADDIDAAGDKETATQSTTTATATDALIVKKCMEGIGPSPIAVTAPVESES